MNWKVTAGHAISRLGERLGVQALTYHRGVMKMYDSFAQRDAPGFTSRLVTVFGPVRYLDVGAGTGRYAQQLTQMGATADACEHSESGRQLAAQRGMKVFPLDLTAEPPGPDPSAYDVAYCLEVAEHIPPGLGDRLVSYLSTAPTVVFTAAHPGQGGTGHINEQPREYWQQCFAAHGQMPQSDLEQSFLAADGDVPGSYLLENLMIFRRQG